MAFHPARAVALALALSVAAPALAQDAPGPETVVATVGGAPVTLGELIAVRRDLPEQYQQLPDEALYDGIREQLINQRLLAEAAVAAKLVDQPDLKRTLEIQRQGLLAEAFMRDAVKTRLTEAALRAEYDTRILTAPAVQEIRASHILVAEEAKARDLRAQIEGGADFAALAVEHGTDGTKAQGGDLGYFSKDAMVPAFADAAFALEVDEVSQPVQTQFGWHLIKLVDKRDQPKPAFEEIRAELEQALGGQMAQSIVLELREKAGVTVDAARPGVAALRDDALIGR